MKIQDFLAENNIADKLDKDLLKKIGSECVKGYEMDAESRREWLDDVEMWTKLAIQVRESKSFPWSGASNIKFPLLTIAAMQFNARAYPALVPSKNVVKGVPQYFVNKPEVTELASRIGAHMSHQLLNEMDGWAEDMDKLLMITPIVGCAFKKTYFNNLTQKNVSELVLPKDLVVNHASTALDTASRVSHVLYMTKNDIKERQNKDIYLKDVNLPAPNGSVTTGDEFRSEETHNGDHTDKYLVIEQHTYYDLDDDGYDEPYIITVELQSNQVLRMVPRFEEEDIDWGPTDNILSIKPTNYFTKFGFIPNPDGGFYDLGFGHLLGPTNEAVNTLVNQLVDAGSLSNLQSGFIAKGLRIQGGNYSFKPGEWKIVIASAEELQKGVFALPVREPSSVLFQLLGRLTDYGMKLASIAEIFVGKMPGQNTPASTTQETVNQGMKLFTSIYKRNYSALTQEFKKLYKLNQRYSPDQPTYPLQLSRAQYKEADVTISPSADADATTNEERQAKAAKLLPLAQAGLINPQIATFNLLESEGYSLDEIKALMSVQPPGPSEKDKELELKGKEVEGKLALEAEKLKGKVMLDAAKFENKMELEKTKHRDGSFFKDKELDLKYLDHLEKKKVGSKKE